MQHRHIAEERIAGNLSYSVVCLTITFTYNNLDTESQAHGSWQRKWKKTNIAAAEIRNQTTNRQTNISEFRPVIITLLSGFFFFFGLIFSFYFLCNGKHAKVGLGGEHILPNYKILEIGENFSWKKLTLNYQNLA